MSTCLQVGAEECIADVVSMLALQLGRPSSIQDRDIDVEMPLNIDVEYTDAQVIFDMQTKQIEATKGRVQGDEYAKGYDTITSVSLSVLYQCCS